MKKRRYPQRQGSKRFPGVVGKEMERAGRLIVMFERVIELVLNRIGRDQQEHRCHQPLDCCVCASRAHRVLITRVSIAQYDSTFVASIV
jgi:hypothetical protein